MESIGIILLIISLACFLLSGALLLLTIKFDDLLRNKYYDALLRYVFAIAIGTEYIGFIILFIWLTAEIIDKYSLLWMDKF